MQSKVSWKPHCNNTTWLYVCWLKIHDITQSFFFSKLSTICVMDVVATCEAQIHSELRSLDILSGMFPYVMLTTTMLFFRFNWPRPVLQYLRDATASRCNRLRTAVLSHVTKETDKDKSSKRKPQQVNTPPVIGIITPDKTPIICQLFNGMQCSFGN